LKRLLGELQLMWDSFNLLSLQLSYNLLAPSPRLVKWEACWVKCRVSEVQCTKWTRGPFYKHSLHTILP